VGLAGVGREVRSLRQPYHINMYNHFDIIPRSNANSRLIALLLYYLRAKFRYGGAESVPFCYVSSIATIDRPRINL
jgi:hypothetical protein